MGGAIIDKSNAKKIILVVAAAVAVIALTALCWPYISALREPEARERFISFVDSLGAWGVAVLFLVQVLQIVVAVIPGEPIEIIAGTMYGAVGGLAVCLAGIVAGSSMVFILVRKYGRKLLNRFFSDADVEKLSFLKTEARRDTTIFLLFLIPGTPKDILTYFAGLTKIETAKFLLISVLARIPSVVTSTIVGANLAEGDWKTALILFAATGALGLAGIWFNDLYLKRKKRGSVGGE